MAEWSQSDRFWGRSLCCVSEVLRVLLRLLPDTGHGALHLP